MAIVIDAFIGTIYKGTCPDNLKKNLRRSGGRIDMQVF